MSHRVLLTGANGFIGAHILSQLLSTSIPVHITVRSASKASRVIADHPNAGNLLTFSIVPDITMPFAFDTALRSTPPFDTIIHTASPYMYREASSSVDFIDPAIKGTTEILRGIKRVAPEVKRVIITSSFAAIGAFGQVDETNKIYTKEDWNPTTLERGLSTTDFNTAYQASKTIAEKSAWDFIAQENPNFDLVVLNPPMVYGPILHSISEPEELNQSNLRIYNLFLKSSRDADMPPNGLPLYVDVRDIAKAHIRAILTPEASNKRFLVTPGTISSQEIADILRKNFTELEDRVPIGELGTSSLGEGAFGADSSLAKRVLGIEFLDKETTFRDLGAQLLELERKG